MRLRVQLQLVAISLGAIVVLTFARRRLQCGSVSAARDVSGAGSSADREDLCAKGLTQIRGLAESIVQGRADPMQLANSIYWVAWEHGAWVGQPGEDMDAEPTCPDLADPGAEFLQLADGLERYQDNAEARNAYVALIRETGEALLAGKPGPEWENRGDPVPWRSAET